MHIGKAGLLVMAAVVLLSACGTDRAPQLMNLRKQSASPDEFSILPTAPLTQPSSYTELPEPTPGGENRADRRPDVILAEALGGSATGGARGDTGLSSTVGRFGVASDIRATLAAEDLEYRRQNDGRLLERVANVNVYYRAYRPIALDSYAELERLRRAGVRTPAAPPDPALLADQ